MEDQAIENLQNASPEDAKRILRKAADDSFLRGVKTATEMIKGQLDLLEKELTDRLQQNKT